MPFLPDNRRNFSYIFFKFLYGRGKILSHRHEADETDFLISQMLRVTFEVTSFLHSTLVGTRVTRFTHFNIHRMRSTQTVI